VCGIVATKKDQWYKRIRPWVGLAGYMLKI